jgi:hypothetical protein
MEVVGEHKAYGWHRQLPAPTQRRDVIGPVKVVMDDGSEMEIGPGDTYVIPPGHDAWVVRDEPVGSIEFSREAVEEFARE